MPRGQDAATESVRISRPAKQKIDQLSFDLQVELGRRVPMSEMIAALVATADRAKLARYLNF